jgi:hypothetical protein
LGGGFGEVAGVVLSDGGLELLVESLVRGFRLRGGGRGGKDRRQEG